MEDKAQQDIVILVVVGCLGMLILVAFIILFVLYYQKKVLAQQNEMQLAENKYQRQLLSAAIQVEEKERERIAKNIHDDVGTLLNVLKLNLSKIARNSGDEELTEELSKENLHLLEESIQSIRGIAKDLVPPTLIKLGYVKAVNELCRHINNSGQIIIRFNQSDLELRLSQQTELQLYRLTNELLNNIVKHSGAKEIDIDFVKQTNSHELMITHNGKGINSEQVKELEALNMGLGLKSIQSRTQLINAQIFYNAPVNEKPNVIVQIPLYGY
ncbi:MAG: sensor histidine kinase [Bacteroidia bacterium]